MSNVSYSVWINEPYYHVYNDDMSKSMNVMEEDNNPVDTGLVFENGDIVYRYINKDPVGFRCN